MSGGLAVKNSLDDECVGSTVVAGVSLGDRVPPVVGKCLDVCVSSGVVCSETGYCSGSTDELVRLPARTADVLTPELADSEGADDGLMGRIVAYYFPMLFMVERSDCPE